MRSKNNSSLSREERRIRDIEKLFKKQEEDEKKKSNKRKLKELRKKERGNIESELSSKGDISENEEIVIPKRKTLLKLARKRMHEEDDSSYLDEESEKKRMKTQNEEGIKDQEKYELDEEEKYEISQTSPKIDMSEASIVSQDSAVLEFNNSDDFGKNFRKGSWLQQYQMAEYKRNCERNKPLDGHSANLTPSSIQLPPNNPSLQFLLDLTREEQQNYMIQQRNRKPSSIKQRLKDNYEITRKYVRSLETYKRNLIGMNGIKSEFDPKQGEVKEGKNSWLKGKGAKIDEINVNLNVNSINVVNEINCCQGPYTQNQNNSSNQSVPSQPKNNINYPGLREFWNDLNECNAEKRKFVDSFDDSRKNGSSYIDLSK